MTNDNYSSNNLDTFLFLDDNDMFSSFTFSDKKELLKRLKSYLIGYRTCLNIDKNYTFGTEIEFEDYNLEKMKRKLEAFLKETDWILKEDSSLIKGGEVISPILYDNANSWLELKKACEMINRYATVGPNTGSHIHIGMHILGNDIIAWNNFLLLWTTYENVIFRFLYGEYNSARKNLVIYAKPVSKRFIDKHKAIDEITLDILNQKGNYTLEDLFLFLNSESQNIEPSSILNLYNITQEDFERMRSRAINFTNILGVNPDDYNRVIDKNTVEIRCPNGTHDSAIWQNNINFIISLFNYAKNDSFNRGLVLNRLFDLSIKKIPSSLKDYSGIYIDEALELADLIFYTNQDKINFLKQYMKDGTTNLGSKQKKRFKYEARLMTLK